MFFAVAMVVGVIAVMIFSAIGTSLWGVELYGIEQEIAKVEAENRQLTAEIVTQMSLTELYQNSQELGFAQPEAVVYVQGENSVAQLLNK